MRFYTDKEIIIQILSSLDNFCLACGTNLALQFNHRISDEIDLIVPKNYLKS